ncbi:hypothetical protein M8J76_012578 [Diaphorina citri]|nr:hypothetical protein M8J76_012578 [Diaphorina citri]KAI5725598.1 hypothetical protein M8J77_017561 [Diaphorina citri]
MKGISWRGSHGSRFLTWYEMKTKYELLPLMGAMTLACGGVAAYLIYCCCTKEFVFWNRKDPPNNGVHCMDLLRPAKYKLYYPHEASKPQPRPDLDQVYGDMRAAWESSD